MIEITWTGDLPLIVIGLYGEAMFRLTDRSVEVNELSPSIWLAVERFGRVTIPPEADAEAEPRWRLLDSGSGPWRWQDPRIQWRRAERPEAVGEGDRRTRIRRWSISLQAGEQQVRVDGVLEWIPSTALLRARRSEVSDPLTSALLLLLAMASGAWVGTQVRGRRARPASANL